jgi:hypothetical protein
LGETKATFRVADGDVHEMSHTDFGLAQFSLLGAQDIADRFEVLKNLLVVGFVHGDKWDGRKAVWLTHHDAPDTTAYAQSPRL